MSNKDIACPTCGESCPSGSRFCEGCGTRIDQIHEAPAMVSCRCGAPEHERDSEGFCLSCGRKASPRDHKEEILSDRFAAVSDVGIRHKKNEDDFAIGVIPEGSVLVVSDGVSSASHSEFVSEVASNIARDRLLIALANHEPMESAVRSAILNAHLAAMEISMGTDGKTDPPGATIVVAALADNQVTVGWAGDSRAYWFGQNSSIPLSRDHSWMNDVVESGKMTPDEAAKNPLAHAITQCIGPLNEVEPETSVTIFRITEPGRILLCSDGLWGYAGSTESLKKLMETAPDSSPIGTARFLTDFANKRGGADNITVAILEVDYPI